MLDIHRVLAETDALAKRLDDRAPGLGEQLRLVLKKYETWKALKQTGEAQQAEKNLLSKLTGEVAKSKAPSMDALPAPLKEQLLKLLGDDASSASGAPLEILKERG